MTALSATDCFLLRTSQIAMTALIKHFHASAHFQFSIKKNTQMSQIKQINTEKQQSTKTTNNDVIANPLLEQGVTMSQLFTQILLVCSVCEEGASQDKQDKTEEVEPRPNNECDDSYFCPLIYYFIFWGEHEDTDL
jgi:hypothetical protein